MAIEIPITDPWHGSTGSGDNYYFYFDAEFGVGDLVGYYHNIEIYRYADDGVTVGEIVLGNDGYYYEIGESWGFGLPGGGATYQIRRVRSIVNQVVITIDENFTGSQANPKYYSAPQAGTPNVIYNGDTVDSGTARNSGDIFNGTDGYRYEVGAKFGINLPLGGGSTYEIKRVGKLIGKLYANGTQVMGLAGMNLYYNLGAGTFIVPPGVYSVKVCMIGGGRSGDAGSASSAATTTAYGGRAGQFITTTYAVTPGQILSTFVGAGGAKVTRGAGAAAGKTLGIAGQNTKFGTLTAAAGSSTFTGQGASKAYPCPDDTATIKDGASASYIKANAYGGQAGVEDASNGLTAPGNINGSTQAGLGCGGGASCVYGTQYTSTSNAGGQGYIQVSWNQ